GERTRSGGCPPARRWSPTSRRSSGFPVLQVREDLKEHARVITYALKESSTIPPLEVSRMQERMQRYGGFMAGMVIPNIGAFIAWGLITAFFIPTGWTPNENLAKLVGPMIVYLLPILICFTGGTLIYGQRGACGRCAGLDCEPAHPAGGHSDRGRQGAVSEQRYQPRHPGPIGSPDVGAGGEGDSLSAGNQSGARAGPAVGVLDGGQGKRQ